MKKNVFNPSTVKNIDQAFFNYFKELDISTITNRGFTEIPVVWAGAERSFQIKKDSFIRDKDGSLILPQIAIVRKKVEKSIDFAKKGTFVSNLLPQSDVKGGTIEWTKVINQEKSTYFQLPQSKNGSYSFNVKPEQRKIVYQHYSIPIPVYLWMEYEVIIRCEYQTQMNDIVQAIVSPLGGANYILVSSEGWKYECFMGEDLGYESNADSFDEDERMFKAALSFNVLGYTIGAGKNQSQPNVSVRENAVSVTLKESIIGEELPRFGTAQVAQVPFEEVLDARFLPLGTLSEWPGHYGKYNATQTSPLLMPNVEKVGNYNAVSFVTGSYMEFNWPDLINIATHPDGGSYEEMTIYTALADAGPQESGRIWAFGRSTEPTLGLNIRHNSSSPTGIKALYMGDDGVNLISNEFISGPVSNPIITTIRINKNGTYDAWSGISRTKISAPFDSTSASLLVDNFTIAAWVRDTGVSLVKTCKIYGIAFGLGAKTDREVLKGIKILKGQYSII